MSSILTDTKQLLGMAEDYTVWDLDILTHINSAIATLGQLGVGPKAGLFVVDKSTDWAALTGNAPALSPVRQYLYLKTRLIFDPPATSAAVDAIKETIRELEWRLNLEYESTEWTPGTQPLPEPGHIIDGGDASD